MTSIDIAPESIIRHLYKSYLSCADFLNPTILELIHITTPVEDKIIFAAKEKKIVFATGNPGDGKTHLIRKVQEEFPADVEVILDANEKDDAALVKSIEKAFNDTSGLVIAINEGILLDLCEKVKTKTLWADAVIKMILKPYDYDDSAQPDTGKLLVLDLSLRNNLSPIVVGQAIEKVTSLVMAELDEKLQYNIQSIQNPIVKNRISMLLDAVGRTGFHSTMRDLLGFLSFLVCGGEDVSEDGTPKPFYVNAFEGGIGALFDRVREFDPIYMPYPFLDERIFMAEDLPEEWYKDAPDEYITPGDIDIFVNRKRRAFFEHKEGEKIFKTERDDVDRSFVSLTKKNHTPEYVAIRLLNKFFDSTRDTETLVLWFGHQYSAQSLRYVASRQEINANEFEVLVPELPATVKDAFPNHYPDHVILKHKSMGISDGLIMDRRFVKLLIAGDRLSGFGVRSIEAQSKIAAFYDRVAKVSTQRKPVVQILKLDNQKIEKIGISDRTYYIPGA